MFFYSYHFKTMIELGIWVLRDFVLGMRVFGSFVLFFFSFESYGYTLCDFSFLFDYVGADVTFMLFQMRVINFL